MEHTVYKHHHSLVVVKKNCPGKIRVCLDFIQLKRFALLTYLKVERMDDLCLKFNGIKRATSLDLVNSYCQIEPTEDCWDLLGICF